ncbi:uncharacterized protein A4U43_C08F4990 [Asparagus officinalis]|nr:uncharacterized protein A4U43_C08F4990 [Asparagus officinalis]
MDIDLPSVGLYKYGKIFKSHLFGRPTVVSCDPEFNYFVLQNEDRLFHSAYPPNIPGVLGDLTLLAVTGDVHKRLRGFAVNLLSSVKTPSSLFLSDIEDNVLKVMDSWKHKKVLQFLAEARKYTFGAVLKQTLSLEFEDPDAVQIFKNLIFVYERNSFSAHQPPRNTLCQSNPRCGCCKCKELYAILWREETVSWFGASDVGDQLLYPPSRPQLLLDSIDGIRLAYSPSLS